MKTLLYIVLLLGFSCPHSLGHRLKQTYTPVLYTIVPEHASFQSAPAPSTLTPNSPQTPPGRHKARPPTFRRKER